MNWQDQYLAARKKAEDKLEIEYQRSIAAGKRQKQVGDKDKEQKDRTFEHNYHLFDPLPFLTQFHQTTLSAGNTPHIAVCFQGSGVYHEKEENIERWLVVFDLHQTRQAIPSGIHDFDYDYYHLLTGIAVFVTPEGWFISDFLDDDSYLQKKYGVNFKGINFNNSPSRTIKLDPASLENLQTTFLELANQHLARLCPEVYGHLSTKPSSTKLNSPSWLSRLLSKS